nr:uncharacterized protein LOC109191529 [Ipomoea batatas]
MGLWLVKNFDPRSYTLQLQNGQTIHITADDVVAVLGLPKGHIEITKRTAKALLEILKEWRWIFEKTTAYITPKALARKMIEVDAMVINALINNKQVWMKSTDKLYGGQFSSSRRIVSRSFPAFKIWTFKLLSKRERDEIQSGGFGYRHVDTALQLENAPTEEDNLSISGSDVPQPPQPQEENTPMPKGLQGFVNEITSHTRTIAMGLPKVARLVENAPTAILKDNSFGLTQEEQTQRWDDVNVVAREYNECE